MSPVPIPDDGADVVPDTRAVADAWGIEESFVDAMGNLQRPSRRTVDQLRSVIGQTPQSSPPLFVDADEPLLLAAGEVVAEDGSITRLVRPETRTLSPGYYDHVAPDGSTRRMIAAPRRCYLPDRASWGWTVQLYAARSRQSWGIGDFGDLRRLTRWSQRAGAAFTLVNPLGAVSPALPQQPSPYYPSSRRFRNPIYLRVEDVPGAAAAPEQVARSARAARKLNDVRVIDRDSVWRLKREALEAIWAAQAPAAEFERWYRSQPSDLHSFAVWSALVEEHGASFRDWPSSCQHPDGAGVGEIARRQDDRIRFHAWLQWLIENQAQDAAGDSVVVHDLPIGVDPHGFDAWSWQDTLALGVSVGAPPDVFNRRGQDWGLPPFVPWRLRAENYQPFIDTIRASLALGRGLRIDHVMGLFRLWWIPEGTDPSEGAYVRYPADELLAIVATESARAQAFVIGEDLGTVEPDVRTALADRDILSYRLLWFEESDPAAWPLKSMASVSTHDLPTVAGLWESSDFESQLEAGLEPDGESTEAIRTRLVEAAGLESSASSSEAVLAAYRVLSEAPSLLLAASLDDALAEPERPNMPGADDKRANWSIGLRLPLEELESESLARDIGQLLNGALADRALINDPRRRE